MLAKLEEKKPSRADNKVRIVVLGEEIIEKKVALSCNCGRVYLPIGWIGKRIKIVRVD